MAAQSTIAEKGLLLSGFAFWDIDLSKMDIDRYADFAIIRIFERGTLEDIRQIQAYFGNTAIKEALINARALAPRAIALGEKLLGISPDQLQCSTSAPRARNCSMY